MANISELINIKDPFDIIKGFIAISNNSTQVCISRMVDILNLYYSKEEVRVIVLINDLFGTFIVNNNPHIYNEGFFNHGNTKKRPISLSHKFNTHNIKLFIMNYLKIIKEEHVDYFKNQNINDNDHKLRNPVTFLLHNNNINTIFDSNIEHFNLSSINLSIFFLVYSSAGAERKAEIFYNLFSRLTLMTIEGFLSIYLSTIIFSELILESFVAENYSNYYNTTLKLFQQSNLKKSHTTMKFGIILASSSVNAIKDKQKEKIKLLYVLSNFNTIISGFTNYIITNLDLDINKDISLYEFNSILEKNKYSLFANQDINFQFDKYLYTNELNYFEKVIECIRFESLSLNHPDFKKYYLEKCIDFDEGQDKSSLRNKAYSILFGTIYDELKFVKNCILSEGFKLREHLEEKKEKNRSDNTKLGTVSIKESTQGFTSKLVKFSKVLKN